MNTFKQWGQEINERLIAAGLSPVNERQQINWTREHIDGPVVVRIDFYRKVDGVWTLYRSEHPP